MQPPQVLLPYHRIFYTPFVEKSNIFTRIYSVHNRIHINLPSLSVYPKRHPHFLQAYCDTLFLLPLAEANGLSWLIFCLCCHIAHNHKFLCKGTTFFLNMQIFRAINVRNFAFHTHSRYPLGSGAASPQIERKQPLRAFGRR